MKQGIYTWSRAELLDFEDAFLDGNQVDLVLTTYSGSFHSVGGITWNEGPESLGETFGPDTSRTLGTIYWMGSNHNDYPAVAAGDYDAEFRRFAKDLINLGISDAYIRPNAEFNIDWSSAYPDDPQTYADAYARFVREMMSVDGANFTFLYSPAQNKIGVADEAWPVDSTYWPSEAEPPILAPSFYDDWWGYDVDTVTDELRQQSWPDHHTENVGKWVTFADDIGASGFGAPEWGVNTIDGQHPGGGDNPWFVDHVFQLLDDANADFQTYWNGQYHKIYPEDQFPRAKATLKENMLARLESGGQTDVPPSVSWVTPTDSATVSGSPSVELDASDDHDGGSDLTVEWRVDGGSWHTASFDSGSGYFKGVWDTTTEDEGNHTLAARATDTSNNTSSESNITVAVDNTDYGGYEQPDPGSSDWHEPLNQNFTDIEADIQDLARRIRKLE